MKSGMGRSQLTLLATLASAGLTSLVCAYAPESPWADATDSIAKAMIASERLWAEAACTHNGIEKTILADDFHGTAPDGSLYSKQEAVADALAAKTTEESCVMYDVKVHFFGDAMAVLYGSESAIRAKADGHKHRVKLTWTDTWLKRHGQWQIVAAQDMPSEMP